MAGFVYQDPFPLGKDETKFRLLEGSGKYVSMVTFDGQEVLKEIGRASCRERV